MEEEFDDLTQSSETASASSRFPSPNYEDLLKLIEHLSLECKDSGSLLKIRDTVHSYKMLVQLKNSHCKALMGKLGTMENEVSGLQKKLSEAEHEKIKQEQELCNLRFALKQEVEKRKSADWVYEKIKGQLREKEEQCNKEIKMKQKLEIRVRELDVELKTVRNNLNEAVEERNGIERQLLQEQNARILQDEILANHLHKQKELKMAQEKISSQLQEALDQHIEPAQCIKKMHDCIQKLGLENCKLKATAKKQAEKIEQLKENLLREILTQAAYEDKLEKLRHKQNASVRTQMKLRIRDLESEFSKMKSQVDCNQIEMENYKQLYLEEVKIRKSLSNKLSKTDEKLAEVKTKLLLERKQNRASQYSTIDTRSVLESTCPRDLSNRLFIPRTFSGEDVMVPTSNLWHSVETTENCKTKVLQEWEQSVTRELRQATAESGLHRTSSLKFTHM
ncbi:ankyrin repeat domain-containing protein 26-like isoform X4 [Peromyscus eremicus]|uniref:ankyrin repeat domain-containing protein 26-like isoform X4 n=1 Tax=Peromyscus eremicus TaxID=42410 RepID=UPI0027DD00A5|nr:ankyrin repeat domain-containing protein 26-like isoform X4 [Peromyscus eremicus]